MNTKNVLSSFEKLAQLWLDDLSTYNEETLLAKPSDESWSIGQVYVHLIDAGLKMQLPAIEKCLAGTDEKRKLAFPGKVIRLLGMLPPAKIKVPASDDYTPKQPESATQIRTRMAQLVAAMQKIEPKLKNADLSAGVQHPAFGAMNANEWFKLVEMHFKHHRRQKSRLDKWLKEAKTLKSA